MAAVPSADAPAGDRPPQVTLVVGAGGVRCAAALGVVKAMADAGIGLERVVGCGAGAVFAALLAFRTEPQESAAITRRLWTRELTARRGGMLGALKARWSGPAAFGDRDDRQLPQRLAAAFGVRRIEDAAMPLHIAATDFTTGDLAELVSGPLALSLHASLARPPAFAPQRVDERLLADGALADPLPVSVAIKHGARAIVAVGFEHAYPQASDRRGGLARRTDAILANNLLRAKIAFHSAAHHAELIVILPEFKHAGRAGADPLAYLIDEGEQAALQQLPYLHHLLARDRMHAVA